MVVAAAVSLRCPVVARPTAKSIRPARRLTVAPRASLSDVGNYLSEAMTQIFKPQENDTPWKGSGTPFTGKITHHEEPARLRQLYELVEQVKLEMEASGEVDPKAALAAADAAGPLEDGGVQEYMTQAVARLFGHNFTGDEVEPKEWSSAGYSSSWRRGSRREVQRQYDRLVRFQKVVKSTLESADKQGAAATK